MNELIIHLNSRSRQEDCISQNKQSSRKIINSHPGRNKMEPDQQPNIDLKMFSRDKYQHKISQKLHQTDLIHQVSLISAEPNRKVRSKKEKLANHQSISNESSEKLPQNSLKCLKLKLDYSIKKMRPAKIVQIRQQSLRYKLEKPHELVTKIRQISLENSNGYLYKYKGSTKTKRQMNSNVSLRRTDGQETVNQADVMREVQRQHMKECNWHTLNRLSRERDIGIYHQALNHIYEEVKGKFINRQKKHDASFELGINKIIIPQRKEKKQLINYTKLIKKLTKHDTSLDKDDDQVHSKEKRKLQNFRISHCRNQTEFVSKKDWENNIDFHFSPWEISPQNKGYE